METVHKPCAEDTGAPVCDSLEFRIERHKEHSNIRFELMERVFNRDPSLGIFQWNLYRHGSDELHVHFDSVRPFCATYRSDWRSSERCNSAASVTNEPSIDGFSDASVFVWIRDIGKDLCPTASVVGLIPLNRCYMNGIDSFEEGWYASPKLLWRFLDRELGSILDGTGIESSHLIDKVVQGGSKVVADLANQDSNSVERMGEIERGRILDLIGRIRLELDNHCIMISPLEIGDSTFQLRKVIICPIDPFKSAIEWVVRHREQSYIRAA